MRELCVAMTMAVGLSARAAAQGSQNPHGSLPQGMECTACHTTDGWTALRKPLAFDHDRQTRFPLTGRHGAATCSGCHLDLKYDQPKVAARECGSCHLDVHLGSLSSDCASCHNTQSFHDAAGLQQHARTRFALTGAHVQVTCVSCHRDDRGGAYAALDPECYSCHREAYRSASRLDHEAAALSQDCTGCHGTITWRTASFDHGALASGFALEGRHARIECTACHVPPAFTLKWSPPAGNDDCVACHRPDYDRQHTGSGYPLTCRTCHTTSDWTRAVFDHVANGNGFALVGAHAPAPCSSCHGQGNALLFPKPTSADDCIACHRTDYDTGHTTTGYPTTCLSCHTTTTFAGATFNHSATVFPLDGAHQQLLCSKCHGANNALLFPKPAGPTDCVACHLADYDREHTGSGYPTTCLSCHTTSTFTGAMFDHAGTSFPLDGAHIVAACSTCHGANNALLFPKPAGPTDCVACHRGDYDRVHTGSGYPTTCLSCHTTSAFTGATFDHSTWFPINSGAHRENWSSCADCHPSPNDYAQFTCISCHQHNRLDMDAKHQNASGYVYDSVKCLGCHPAGRR